METNHFSLFGVRIDLLTRKEILENIRNSLQGKKPLALGTLNPEILLLARNDMQYQNILNAHTLNIIDGFGLSLVIFLKTGKWHTRFPGADMLKEILKVANTHSLSLFLALRKDGLSSYTETRESILKKYPNIAISGKEFAISDPRFEIRVLGSHIILCNFGAPEQEIFLQNLKNTENTLTIGIGGAIDFLTGKLPRAPKYMRKCGLEWLYRLWRQPKRLRRIFRAVIVFPVLAIFTK